jgi:pimeloyl-ACP methyl ester carboxylesterase
MRPTEGVFVRSTVLRAALGALLATLLVSSAACAPPPVPPARCRPSADHRRPVVMLHGLGGNAESNWFYMAPALREAGYCVYTLTYGQAVPEIAIGGLRPVAESADRIVDYITEVRRVTGADKVDLVGHSQGGLHALYITKVLGLREHVGTVVALAPPTHGTTVSGLIDFATLAGLRGYVDDVLRAYGCFACIDALPGSDLLDELADGPIAHRHVDYTIVTSRYDVVVTPTDSSFVNEPGVHNVEIQDLCPADPVGHVGLAFDPGVLDIVRNALDPAHSQDVRCGTGPAW